VERTKAQAQSKLLPKQVSLINVAHHRDRSLCSTYILKAKMICCLFLFKLVRNTPKTGLIWFILVWSFLVPKVRHFTYIIETWRHDVHCLYVPKTQTQFTYLLPLRSEGT
jgi:hypothetical protein